MPPRRRHRVRSIRPPRAVVAMDHPWAARHSNGGRNSGGATARRRPAACPGEQLRPHSFSESGDGQHVEPKVATTRDIERNRPTGAARQPAGKRNLEELVAEPATQSHNVASRASAAGSRGEPMPRLGRELREKALADVGEHKACALPTTESPRHPTMCGRAELEDLFGRAVPELVDTPYDGRYRWLEEETSVRPGQPLKASVRCGDVDSAGEKTGGQPVRRIALVTREIIPVDGHQPVADCRDWRSYGTGGMAASPRQPSP